MTSAPANIAPSAPSAVVTGLPPMRLDAIAQSDAALTPEHGAPDDTTGRLELAIVVVDGDREHEFWLSLDSTASGAALYGLMQERGLPIEAHRHLIVERTGQQLHGCSRLGDVGLVDGERLSLEDLGTSAARAGRSSVCHLRFAFTEGPLAGDAVDVVEHIDFGRDEHPDVVYLEEGTVSRRHARLTLVDAGAEICDLGSTNGTFVNGRRIDRPTVLMPGDRIGIGPHTGVVQTRGLPRRALGGPHLDVDGGRLRFNRSPRTIAVPPEAAMALPEPPETPPKRRFPIAAAIAPLGLGLAMAFLFSPIYALFTAMSPVMMAFTYIDDRRSGRKQFKLDSAEFRSSLGAFRLEVQDRMDEVAGHARSLLPPVHLLRWWTRLAAAPLWLRRPHDQDFLLVCPADVGERSLLAFEGGRVGDDALLEERDDFVADLAGAPDIPVPINLAEVPVVGLCGAPEAVVDIARSLVVGATALISPRFLKVAIAAPAHQPDWGWTKWLPHTVASSGEGRLVAGTDAEATSIFEWLERLIAERLDEATQRIGGSYAASLPHVLVVVQGPIEVSRRTLSRVLDRALAAGVSVIFVGEHRHDLPAQTGVLIEARGDACDITVTATSERTLAATARRTSAADALSFARDMAPLVDVTASSASGSMPRSVSVGDMRDTKSLSPDSIVARWTAFDGSLKGVVGATAESPFALDLRRDGPHALVAGTTGSGKSEFLQSLVTSLALDNSPERLNFILIDYKGGAAFSECVELPHTIGYVTNLDDRLAERALASMRAELRRRERLLLAAGAKDLMMLERSDPSAAPPALVIVIDEFAALKTEVPAFVDGLVDIAQRGRSMGVHMILATQKPSGVITAQIEANTNIRVALRVAGTAESSEVLGVPDAAAISNSTPGRCLVKVGARKEDIVEMQSVYVGGHTLGEVTLPDVLDTFRFGMSGPRALEPVLEASSRTDLEHLVAAANGAWRHMDGPELHRPWLPELGHHVGLDEITAPSGEHQARFPIGLADFPDEQRQAPFMLDVAQAGNVAIYGAPGSGKTTLLRTIATSVAIHSSPDHAVVFGVDCATGGLASLTPLPNVAEIIDGRDIEQVRLLLRVLDREVDSRRTAMGRAGVSSLAEWRAASDAAPPAIIVMIDGFGQLWATLEELRMHHTSTDLVRLIVDGRSVGIHFVLTGDKRSALSSQVTTAIGLTFVQRMASTEDYIYLGLRDVTSDGLPPGRTLMPEGGEFQAAVCGHDDDTTGSRQAEIISVVAGQLADHAMPTAMRLPVLPDRIAADELGLALSLDAIPVGVDEFVDGVTLNLERSPLVLIVGPNGSGRSRTVEMFGHQLRHVAPERHVVACRRGSPLVDSTAFTKVVTARGGDHLEALLDTIKLRCEHGWKKPLLVAIDDADDYLEAHGADALTTIVQRSGEAGVIVVAAAHNFLAANSYASWVRMMRSVGIGIVLQPESREDTDAFGVPFPPIAIDTMGVGRGLVIAQRTVTLTQLALAENGLRRRSEAFSDLEVTQKMVRGDLSLFSPLAETVTITPSPIRTPTPMEQ